MAVNIRRVVTGNDAEGRSGIVWDGQPPDSNEEGKIGSATLWLWNETPAPLSSGVDAAKLRWFFPGPFDGGVLHIFDRPPPVIPAGYDPAKDPNAVPLQHEPRRAPLPRRWDRGGTSLSTGAMHKTQTIDYGLVLEKERHLVLDDGSDLTMRPGDIVVQVGAWHQWNSPLGGVMAFDMFSAEFVGGIPNKIQPSVAPISAAGLKLPEGVKPARRIVTIDTDEGSSILVSDGPAPDVRFDPARPGFASSRLWVTDSHPAKIVKETLDAPHTIEPPQCGSICRVVTFPPDAGWAGKVGEREVRAYFQAMGSPGASTYSPQARHPYMQKSRSLDMCLVIEGEVTLVLDRQETTLKAKDAAILRGANHAFSNRTNNPAVVAIFSHDGAW